LLVAGSFIASEKLSGIISPFSLTLLRFVGASVLLFPFVMYKRKWRSKIISTLPRASIISFFYSGFFIGLFESLNTTTSLNTSTLFTLVPLITAIFSIVAFGNKLKTINILVYILGGIGTVWVIFKGQLNVLLSFSLNEGDLIFLIAIVCMALYSIAMKYLYRNDDIIVLVFCTLVGGSFWMVTSLIYMGQPLQWDLIQGDSIYYMIYLIIGATLATAYFYQIATVALGPSRVSAYIYLNPALVVVLLFFIDVVSINNAILPGIAISIFATFVLQYQNKVSIKVP
jgi:drug/metabolite transporter (DMT)-like permease